jgi:hypothetical protein
MHPHHFIQHSNNYNENFSLKRKSPSDDIVINNNENERLKEINLITSPANKRISSNNNTSFISPPIQPKLISPLLHMPLGPSYSSFSMPPPSQSSIINHISTSPTTNDLHSNSTSVTNQLLAKTSKQAVPLNTNVSNKYANNTNPVNNYSLNTHQLANSHYQSGINQSIESSPSNINSQGLLSFSSNTNKSNNNNNNTNHIKLEEIHFLRKMREKEKHFSGCNIHNLIYFSNQNSFILLIKN